MSTAHKGVMLSSEHCAAIGAGRTGHVVSEETRRKIGDKHRGKVVGDETKELLRKSAKDQWANLHFREKNQGALQNFIDAGRLAVSADWATAEGRQRRLDGIRAYWADPENRKKHSERCRAARAV